MSNVLYPNQKQRASKIAHENVFTANDEKNVDEINDENNKSNEVKKRRN